jgi:sRNA-binding regulator protein Hfq
MSNRKLIRPSLADIKDQIPSSRPPRRKPSPNEQTNAENFYYTKQIQNRTPMVLMLQDGEVLKGTIDWYDRNSIRINRQSEPDVLVLKHYIKYMYKENEDKEND